MANEAKGNAALSPEQLKKHIDPAVFAFETTEEVPALQSIVGQKRGRNVMDFGLTMNQEGYNMYVSGIPGTGKTSFTYSIVNDFAKKPVTLYDWCYVYNFAEENYKPRVLQLPAGTGRQLKEDMEKFVKELETEIPSAFQEENYQKDKTALIQKYKQENDAQIAELDKMAHAYGFQIKHTSQGMITVPLKDGKVIGEQEYRNLTDTEKKEIEKNSNQLQEKIIAFTNSFRTIEKKMKKELETLDQHVALTAAEIHLEGLMKKYASIKEIQTFFQEVKADILKNIQDFLPQQEEQQGNPLQAMAGLGKNKNYTIKYQVNVLVDHHDPKGAPVVTADNPTYYNVIGKLEYENRMGVMTTDFTKIKPGYLHLANGGYLIMQVSDILSNRYAWEGLKRALKTKQIQIENIGEQAGLMATTSMKPEPIPLDVKVILIGNQELYQLLYHHDEDFSKLFKIKADFDVEMQANEENMHGLARFIHSHCVDHQLRHFDRNAVAKIIEYSGRLTSNQAKLSTRFNQIVEIIYEADTWARVDEDEIVTVSHVVKALSENEYRHNLFEEKVQESIDVGDIFIATEGKEIGQVNGLAVYNSGQYSFGKPSRITATTFIGKNGIINIERESNMSGSIHNKGVYILAGYLGQMFAQNQALSLTAHIAFEQSYGGVDGDSASSTELYAILSSLAGVPIDQGLAVTGSVNQKGEIQPIGGVNEKIEGFYEVCKNKGITGKQGVLIPFQNIKNLMLKDEVIIAVKKGNFHIYAVKTVTEGLAILTGESIDRLDADGKYAPGTVYEKVTAKLKRYYKIAKANKA